MPLDASILLQGRGIQLPDPVALATQGVTLADLANRGQLQQYALKQAQRKDMATQALGQLLPQLQQAGFSDESVQQALQHPLVQQNPDVASAILETVDARRKSESASRKDAAIAFKDTAEGKIKLLQPLTNQAYELYNKRDLSPADIAEFSKKIAANGLQDLVRNIPFQDWNNPEAARKNLKTIGSAFFEAEKQVSTAETAQHNRTTEQQQAGNYASEAARRAAETSQGWSRLSQDRETAGKPVIQTDAEGNMYAVNPKTATGVPVLGPDNQPLVKGQKPLTESQGTATAFAMRMRDARGTIDKLESSGAVDPSGVLVSMSGGQGPLDTPANAAAGFLNPQAQVYDQAKQNWVTANLRKESGAAISIPEMAAEKAKWFPIQGDSKQVIAAKRAARETAERAMIVQAGPGSKNVPAPEQGGTTAEGKIGSTFSDKRPDPASVAPGTKLRNTQTGQIEVSDGKNWKLAQ